MCQSEYYPLNSTTERSIIFIIIHARCRACMRCVPFDFDAYGTSPSCLVRIVRSSFHLCCRLYFDAVATIPLKRREREEEKKNGYEVFQMIYEVHANMICHSACDARPSYKNLKCKVFKIYTQHSCGHKTIIIIIIISFLVRSNGMKISLRALGK